MSRLWRAYMLRHKRRRLLIRSWIKRRQLTCRRDLTATIRPDDVLTFACIRNEIAVLPAWLAHYRKLGVRHFLIVDNNSDDGTTAFLLEQPDVSLWHTTHSYRLSRFGMDWLGALQIKHGGGHWCLTVDADEFLVYPHCETHDLPSLTSWLRQSGHRSFGALMLDMFPKGPVGQTMFNAGDDPIAKLGWFDAYPYWAQLQPKMENLWFQGGPRARVFFADDQTRAPTLNKVPLVDWSRRYCYVSSTHNILPRQLNHTYDENGVTKATGVLLHTKFLNTVVPKAQEELDRQQHFADPAQYRSYYDAVISDPVLWSPEAFQYKGPDQLLALNLMSAGDWGQFGNIDD